LRKIRSQFLTLCRFTVIIIGTLLLHSAPGYSAQTGLDVENIVVKLSYLGDQNKSVSSLLFSVTVTETLNDKFSAHNALYETDKTRIVNLITTKDELVKIIDAVTTFKNDSAHIELSAVLLDTNKDTLSEFKLNRRLASQLYSDILNIIKTNPASVEVVTKWGDTAGFNIP
jgi:hypothetical protein